MSDKRNVVQMQIRLPENLYAEVKQEAEDIGVSMNAHLMELIWLGIKARKSFPILGIDECQSHH